MKIISEKNKEVHACIGHQTFYPWTKYKDFLYSIKVTTEDGILWYNLLTREIILLEEHEDKMMEAGNDYILNQLVKKWYLVPEDIDQKSLIYSFWQNYYSRHPFVRSRLSLVTIFTTTECNARCPYCYEYKTSKNTMSMTIAEYTAEYIVRNAGRELTLKWFGGEPLLNPDVMDYICEHVAASGITYTSSIVSNAYLLDRITDEQIVDIWKLNGIQITIDGTKEEYLRIKGLPDDAYEKLMETIKRLARLQVKVTIRLHVTRDNASDLMELAAELKDQLTELGKYRQNVHAYVAPLFEGLGKDGNLITDEERNRLYDDYIAVCDQLTKLGLSGNPGIPGVRGKHCMADNGHSIVVTPTGALTPCEHHVDTEICGNVFDGGRIPDKWRERTPEVPECATCFYYPQCVKLKLCEGESPCNDSNRRFMRYQAEKVARNTYERFKKGETGNAKGTGSSRSGSRLSGNR